VLGGGRRLEEMEVRVGQTRNRDLARLQLDPEGVRVGPRLELHGAAGEGDPATPDPDGLDPAEPVVPRKGRDPAADERIERHQPFAPAPTGPRSSSASSSRPSPAPRPRARAIRAFGPVRVPASIAPARTHVAPPPRKA